MVLDRRSARAGTLLLLAVFFPAVAGCDSSQHSTAQHQSTPPAASPTLSPPVRTAAPTSTPAGTRPVSAAPTSRAPAATSVAVVRPPSSAVTVPAHLCSGMDAAQNAADAYMGALSAGNAAEASACVLPNTVPAALTRSLLAKAGSTVAYLPRDGVDGPTVFGYQGGGRLIDVTVAKQPGGQFRVTKVVIHSG